MTSSHNQHMSREADILQKALSHVESFQKKLAAVGCLIQLKAQFSPQEYALFADVVKAQDLEISLQKSRSGAYLPEALSHIDQDLKKAEYSFEGLLALKAALEKGAPLNVLYQAGEKSLEEIEAAAQQGRFALSASFDPGISALLLQDLLQELSRCLHGFTLLGCGIIPNFAKPWLNLLISIIANQIQAWQEAADADSLRNGLVSILMAQDWENDPTLLALTVKDSLDALDSHLPGASQRAQEEKIESALQEVVDDISSSSKEEPDEIEADEERSEPEKDPEEEANPRPNLTWDDFEDEPAPDKAASTTESKVEDEETPEGELDESEAEDEMEWDFEDDEDLETAAEPEAVTSTEDEMEWDFEDDEDLETAAEPEAASDRDDDDDDALEDSELQASVEWEYEDDLSSDTGLAKDEFAIEGNREKDEDNPEPSALEEVVDLDMALPPAYEMEEVDEMQLGPARLDSDFAQAQVIMVEISKLSWVKDLVFAAIAREFTSVLIPGEQKRSDAAWAQHRTYTNVRSGSLSGPSFQRFRLELEALERTSPFEKAVRVAPLYAAIVGFMQKVLINSGDISKPEHAQKVWPYNQDSAQYLEGLYITCLRVQRLVEEALHKHAGDHQPFVIEIFEKLGQEGDVDSDAGNALRMVILTFWTFLQIEIEVVMVELEMSLEAAKVMMPDDIMQGANGDLIDLIDFHITRARKMSPDITRAYSIAAQLYHEGSYVDLARQHMRFIRSLEKHNGQWGQWLADLQEKIKS